MSDAAKKTITHVERLCVDIGPRPVGTRTNRAAADYIDSVFLTAGLDIERQWFSCTDWDQEETIPELDGHRLQAAAKWFSPPCDVRGIPIPVATVEQLADANLSGRIGILYGNLTTGTLTPKRFKAFNPEHHQRIVRLLEEKHPAATITVSLMNAVPGSSD